MTFPSVVKAIFGSTNPLEPVLVEHFGQYIGYFLSLFVWVELFVSLFGKPVPLQLLPGLRSDRRGSPINRFPSSSILGASL